MFPPPGEPRVVGAGRKPRSQQAERRASASGPAPISRATFPGLRRPSQGTFLPAEAWRAPAKACPAAGQNRRLAKPLLCVIIVFLHIVLPKGFNSWTQVLTDWAVSRAFTGMGPPECLKGHPEFAVPFVAAISAAIREKQLHRAVVEAILVQEQATEPAYDEAGGPAYLRLREAMEAAQNDYFEESRPLRRGEPAKGDVAAAEARMIQLQSDFDRTRDQHAEFVRSARSTAARQFWSKRPTRGLPDTFFADAPFAAPASRLARIHPVWWGGFFGRLQQALAFGHPAEGELLDRLPHLRKSATKKTLAAVIDEWRAEHNDRWGWYGEVHYRMLALRSAKKAACLTHWFNARAPGYLMSDARRFALQLDLADHLAQVDPWLVPACDAHTALSEHGPN